MSWSLAFIGTPDKITDALENYSKNMDDASKQEYNLALPHLKGLIALNHNATSPTLELKASGHAYSNGSQSIYSVCNVSIAPLAGTLV